MKHLKLFENFETYKGLPSEQEEDLREIFWDLITQKDMNYEEAVEYFKPGTDTFHSFLMKLESELDWFDWRQMNEIFHEISIYLLDLEDDEPIEWDENE